MSVSIRLMPDTVRSLAFGSIAAGYTGIGTAISKPCRIFLMQNLTDANLMFSFDGINDHFPLASWGYILLDITANKTLNQGYFLAEGQRLYVKQLEIPTTGSVYLTTFYGAD